METGLRRVKPGCLIDIRRYQSNESDLQVEIVKGLKKSPKELPSLLLWNSEGLELYEKLKAERDDYYLPRLEEEIISTHAEEIARKIPNKSTVLELGSG